MEGNITINVNELTEILRKEFNSEFATVKSIEIFDTVEEKQIKKRRRRKIKLFGGDMLDIGVELKG